MPTFEPFDIWNTAKKRLQYVPQEPFFKEGEIWWCAIGMNVGHEYNGKNDNFERPVLIIVKINSTTAWTLPITSRNIADRYRFTLSNIGTQVVLSQVRTMSSRRLLRKIGEADASDFNSIANNLIEIIQTTKLRHAAENLGDPKGSAVNKV